MVSSTSQRDHKIVVRPVPSIRVVVRIRFRMGRSSFFAPRVALLLAAFLVAAISIANLRRDPPPPVRLSIEPETALLPSRAAALPRRIVYPYSIVPGGVASAAEAIEAAERDPLVREHYDGFDLRRASMTDNSQPLFMHVSYRKGGKIYWTRGKVQIQPGERLLTDGAKLIRARCGNRIAAAPEGEVEPARQAVSERILDQPILEEETADSDPLGPFASALPAAGLVDPVPSPLWHSLMADARSGDTSSPGLGFLPLGPGVGAGVPRGGGVGVPASPAEPGVIPGPVQPDPPTGPGQPPGAGGAKPPQGSFPDPEEPEPYPLPAVRPARNVPAPPDAPGDNGDGTAGPGDIPGTPGGSTNPEPQNPGSSEPGTTGPGSTDTGPVIPGVDVPPDFTVPQEGEQPPPGEPTTPVPEPSTMVLAGAALAAGWFLYRRRA